MKRTIFVGDVHGKTNKLAAICEQHGGDDVFQVGDMGLGFPRITLPNFDNLQFIRGNHDNPQVCREHPCYAGEFGYTPHKDLFFMGGAWSIDHSVRIEGRDWWADEQLSDKQLEDAFSLYKETCPSIMVSHEAPVNAAKAVLERVVKVGTPFYFKGNTGVYVPTRTSEMLQRMLEYAQPMEWFFGHYHIDHNFALNAGGTNFHCLNELSVFPLDTRG